MQLQEDSEDSTAEDEVTLCSVLVLILGTHTLVLLEQEKETCKMEDAAESTDQKAAQGPTGEDVLETLPEQTISGDDAEMPEDEADLEDSRVDGATGEAQDGSSGASNASTRALPTSTPSSCRTATRYLSRVGYACRSRPAISRRARCPRCWPSASSTGTCSC